jgi:hypothetical protein
MVCSSVRADSDVCGICGQGAGKEGSAWYKKLYHTCLNIPEPPTGQLKVYAGHKYHLLCLDRLNEKDYLKFPPDQFRQGCLDGLTERNYKKAYEEFQDQGPFSNRAEKILQEIESRYFGLGQQPNLEDIDTRKEHRQRIYRALTERDLEIECRELKGMVCIVIAVGIVVGGVLLLS